MLGITFKENCPDVRNTKVISVVNELKEYGCNVEVYDPWANPEEVMHEYCLKLLEISGLPALQLKSYDAILLAVAHNEFKTIDLSKKKKEAIVYDLKSIWPKNMVDARL